MKTFVTSDQHFFHDNIVKYCNRPVSAEYQNQFIVDSYNSVVSENDTCIFLGDLSCNLQGREDELKELVSQMNGTKILILGNHDHCSLDFYRSLFKEVYPEYMIIKNKFFSHYTLFANSKYSLEYDNKLIKIFKENNCKEIYHGHIHEKSSDNWADGYKRINSCVDYNNFLPVLVDF